MKKIVASKAGDEEVNQQPDYEPAKPLASRSSVLGLLAAVLICHIFASCVAHLVMYLLVLHQGNPVIVHARWFILAPRDIFKDLGSPYWFRIPAWQIWLAYLLPLALTVLPVWRFSRKIISRLQ